MGVALGDYDRDGFTDFYVTNIDDAGAAQEQRRRHLQRPRPRRRRGAGQDRRPHGQLGRLGTAFVDYDNDADQDLYLAAGYLDTDQDTNPAIVAAFRRIGLSRQGSVFVSPRDQFLVSLDSCARSFGAGSVSDTPRR